MIGRPRPSINCATGVMIFPSGFTSRMATSKSVDRASRQSLVEAPRLRRGDMAKFFEHVRDHHTDHGLVLDDEHPQALRTHINARPP
jgi:hypothetical protein